MRGPLNFLSLGQKLLLILLVSVFSFVDFASAQAQPSAYGDLVPPHPNTAGWQPTATECSLMDRGTQSNTVVSMYDLSNPDWRRFIEIRNGNLNDAGTVIGTIPWYKNNYGNGSTDANCNNTNNGHGSWTSAEKSAWTSFWGVHKSNMDRVFASTPDYQTDKEDPLQASGPINSLGIRWMQVYITWACGFPLKADGRIGIKTLNAVRFCAEYASFKPGFYWYLLQDDNEAIGEDAGKECIIRNKIDVSVMQAEDLENGVLKSSVTSQQFEAKYGLPLCPQGPCTGNCTPEFLSKYDTELNKWMSPDPDPAKPADSCCVDIAKMISLTSDTDPQPLEDLDENHPLFELANDMEELKKESTDPTLESSIDFCPYPCSGNCNPLVYAHYKLFLKELSSGLCCVDVDKATELNRDPAAILSGIIESNAFFNFDGDPITLCDDPNSCTFSTPQKTELTNLNTPTRTVFDPEKCCLDFDENDAELLAQVNAALASDSSAAVQTYDPSKHKCPEANDCADQWGNMYDVVKDKINPTTCCLTQEQYDGYVQGATATNSSTTDITAPNPSSYTLAQLEAAKKSVEDSGNVAVCESGTCELEGDHVIITESGGCECEDPYEKSDKDPTKCVKKCNIDTCECGIKLNTRVPWIGRCIMFGNTNNTNDIEFVGSNEDGVNIVINPLNAFPVLATALTRIGMTFFLLLSFASLIVAGVLMTMQGVAGTYSRGKDLIIKVIISIALIGLVGAILNAINPNFFTLG